MVRTTYTHTPLVGYVFPGLSFPANADAELLVEGCRRMTDKHRSGGGGQALTLFALVTPVILAFMALGLDAAHAFLERRDAQGAADLAALAGARFLHDDVTADRPGERARRSGRDRRRERLRRPAQVTATTPYDGAIDKIRVNIDSDVSTFFMPILDLFAGGDHSTVNVDAHAVAYGGYTEGEGGGFAIFALESCPSLQKSVDISGSTSFYIGKVHSNSDVYISGSDLSITGPTTHSCGSGYPSFHDGGGGNTYDPAPTPRPDGPRSRAGPDRQGALRLHVRLPRPEHGHVGPGEQRRVVGRAARRPPRRCAPGRTARVAPTAASSSRTPTSASRLSSRVPAA